MGRFGEITGLLVLVLILSGCTGTGEIPRKTVMAVPLVWPDPPEPARIVYVSSFSDAEDLGISEGPFSALARILFGEKQLRLVRPMAIVVSMDKIYVADPGAKGVHRFDKSKNEHHLIIRDDNQPLPSPVGLALGNGGEVYVTDSVLGQVFLIQPDSNIAIPVPLVLQLKQPTGIAFDSERNELFVVDTAAHQVNIFNQDGKLLRQFGQRGDTDGAFNFPTFIWRTPDGAIYVVDALNFRIQVFDRTGKWQSKFGRHGDGSGDLARHKGIATDSHGHVYIVDALFHAFQIFDPKGNFLLSVGELGQAPGEFWLPSGIYIDKTDSIYVADSYNQRVQIFQFVGQST